MNYLRSIVSIFQGCTNIYIQPFALRQEAFSLVSFRKFSAWFKNGSFWVTKTIECLPSFSMRVMTI